MKSPDVCLTQTALAARWRVDRRMQEDEEVVTVIPEAGPAERAGGAGAGSSSRLWSPLGSL